MDPEFFKKHINKYFIHKVKKILQCSLNIYYPHITQVKNYLMIKKYIVNILIRYDSDLYP